MQPGPIYAITDPALLPAHQLVAGVAAALRGGVRTVQYRDKTAGHAERLARAKALLQVCNDGAAALIINDDVELAAETGAHGVHLGQGDGSPALARQRLGPAAIIGVTCHANLQAAEQAVADGASYLAFGRFYNSNTKPGAPLAPLAVLSAARDRFTLPVVAIGGVSLDNMPSLLGAGAMSLAVCHSLFAHADIERAAQQLVSRYQALVQLQNDN